MELNCRYPSERSQLSAAPTTERSAYPRPWRHVPTLKTIHDKDALENYFNLHRKPTASGSNSDSLPSPPPLSFDWEAEILSSSRSSSTASSSSHPLIHLPHLLRIVGPSFLTIYKHLLSRRRVLFLTAAPVEAACLLTKACVDVAFPDVVMGSAGENGSGSATEDEAGLERDDRRPAVLGQVGLMDIDRLKAESQKGLGWIACKFATLRPFFSLGATKLTLGLRNRYNRLHFQRPPSPLRPYR